MRLSPPTTAPPRAVMISVDVPHDDATAAVRGVDVVRKLLPVFRTHAIHVTWGVADLDSEVAAQISAAEPRNQVDLWIDARPSASAGLRGQIRRRLEVAAEAAERTGRALAGVVIRGAESVPQLDLLIKHGISLAATDRRIAGSDAAMVTLRYGLWELPAALAVPGAGSGAAGHLSRRSLDRRIGRNETLHVAIHGAAAAADSNAIRNLDRLLRHIDRRRSQQRLQVLNSADIVSHLKPDRSALGARSILRIDTGQRRAA